MFASIKVCSFRTVKWRVKINSFLSADWLYNWPDTISLRLVLQSPVRHDRALV